MAVAPRIAGHIATRTRRDISATKEGHPLKRGERRALDVRDGGLHIGKPFVQLPRWRALRLASSPSLVILHALLIQSADTTKANLKRFVGFSIVNFVCGGSIFNIAVVRYA